MTYHCEIKEMPAQPSVSIRARTKVENLPETLGRAFGAIIQYLGEQGQQPAGAPYVAYYNQDMTDLDVEIGFPVSQTMPGKGEIRASRIPGGKMGTCLYTGPYQEMVPAYGALHKLVDEKGLEPTGVAYEIYYNSPMDTEPAKLQTLILFPLKG